MNSELALAQDLSPQAWRQVHWQARRRAIFWSLRRILFLPGLAIAAAVGVIKAWEGLTSIVGFALSPFFALAGLVVHGRDIVQTLSGRVEILAGEVLGRFPDDYDEATFGFETGRKREFLIEAGSSYVPSATGSSELPRPEPRALRATRRAVRDLKAGDDAVVAIVNERILDRLTRLTG